MFFCRYSLLKMYSKTVKKKSGWLRWLMKITGDVIMFPERASSWHDGSCGPEGGWRADVTQPRPLFGAFWWLRCLTAVNIAVWTSTPTCICVAWHVHSRDNLGLVQSYFIDFFMWLKINKSFFGPQFSSTHRKAIVPAVISSDDLFTISHLNAIKKNDVFVLFMSSFIHYLCSTKQGIQSLDSNPGPNCDADALNTVSPCDVL